MKRLFEITDNNATTPHSTLVRAASAEAAFHAYLAATDQIGRFTKLRKVKAYQNERGEEEWQVTVTHGSTFSSQTLWAQAAKVIEA